MAQCHTDGRKHPSAMDLYVGCLNSKLYSPNRDFGHERNWSRYNVASYNGSSVHESFHKEAIADSYGGSFREGGSKTPSVDVDFSGANRAGGLSSRIDLHVGSTQNGAPAPYCNGNGIHLKSNAKAGPGSTKKQATELEDSKVANFATNVANGIAFSNEEGGNIANARHSNADEVKECAKYEASLSPPERVSVEVKGDEAPRTQKDFEFARSKSMSRLQRSMEQMGIATPLRKSGEQREIGANGMKANSNDGSTKCSLSRGSLLVGSLKVGGHGLADSLPSNCGSPTPKEGGRWPSGSSLGSVDSSCSLGGSPTAKDGGKRMTFSNGGSSDGGSPVAKDGRRSGLGGYGSSDSSSSNGEGPTPKDGWRRPSVGNVLNFRETSASVSSRGMGNIMGGGNITGNVGNSKISTSKLSPSSERRPLEASTPRYTGDGNILGRTVVGSNVDNLSKCNLDAHTQSRDASSHWACGKDFKRGVDYEDPEEIKNAGNEMYRKGHFVEAVVLYDKAIALCPSHAAYRSNKAAALSGLGKLGEAVQECEEAIKLDPLYSRAHQRAASLYLRLGLTESAKRHIQAAGQQAVTKEAHNTQMVERHISKCIEARKSGDWRSVLKESDAALVSGADSAPQVFGYKAEALLKLHRLEEADDVCAKALKVECSLRKLGVLPGDSFLYMLRAQIEMSLGRFEGAIGAAEVASHIDPRNAEAGALLRKARAVGQTRISGNELFKSGRFFEACAMYGEGLESDPTNAVLLCNRAACRSKLGQWEKAIEDCDAALNIQPNYIKALMRRAHCSTKLERWEDALQDFETLRREMPGDMEVARGLFDVQVALKKSRGEEIYRMKFGGDIEEVFGMDQFREAVSAPGLSVVQFCAKWSDRCNRLAPFIDQLCKHYPCVSFVKVDVDENAYLAKIESISIVPTFKIYKSGHKVKEILGPSQQSLEYAIKHYSL